MEQLLQLDFFQGALPLQVVIGILVCIGILAFIVFLITMAIKELIVDPISRVIGCAKWKAKEQNEKKEQRIIFENAKSRFSQNPMVTSWAEQFSNHIISVIQNQVSDYRKKPWIKIITVVFEVECEAQSISLRCRALWKKLDEIAFNEIGLAPIAERSEIAALTLIMKSRIANISTKKLDSLGITDCALEIPNKEATYQEEYYHGKYYKYYESGGVIECKIQNPAYVEPKAW